MNDKTIFNKYDAIKIDNQLCFRLYNVSKAMTKAYGPLLNEIDLTYPQYITMMVMWEHEKIPFKELGSILRMKTGTLTPLLQRLELKDLLKREKDENDDRKVQIYLTAKGKELKDKAFQIPEKLAKCIGLTMEEYWTYIKVLDQLRAKLETKI